MQSNRKLILLELNELTPRLMSRFIDEDVLPNFRRLRDESQVFLTDAGEDPPLLEPWIQWATVHSGVPYAQHGIQHLGDSHRTGVPAVWDCVSRSGRNVWVCGSMNTWHAPDPNGAILPDPWARHVRPTPRELDPYFDFVRAHVLEYTRDEVPMTKQKLFAFFKFMRQHGLRLGTVVAIARQITTEQFAETRWKRAAILDRLQFDLFRWYYKKNGPALSAFFSNSTAHYQHVYWRNMEPTLFSNAPRKSEQSVHQHSVRFGYQQMDRMVGEVFRMADPATVIVMLSALSQQPCLKYEATGGKTYYKPTDYHEFLRFSGIDSTKCSVEPVMSEEFHIRSADSVYVAQIEQRLKCLRVSGQPAIRFRRDENGVIGGCAIFTEVPPDEMLTNGCVTTPFSRIFYHVDLTKSGMHDRPGLLWVRDPTLTPKVEAEPVDLTDVAPTILSLLNVPIPTHMTGRNRLSLVDR